MPPTGGCPATSHMRRASLVSTYGASGHPYWTAVQDAQHRDVDVLMLYPLDLVAVDERFGSWMTQYGYANYITRAKLLERGTSAMARSIWRAVASPRSWPCSNRSRRPSCLQLMRQLVEQGGRVVWSGPPPVLLFDGRDAREAWTSLFGVDYTPQRDEGLLAPGRIVSVSWATWRRGATDDPHRLPRGPHLSRDAASRDGRRSPPSSSTSSALVVRIQAAARRLSSATDPGTISPAASATKRATGSTCCSRSAPIRRPVDTQGPMTTPSTCRGLRTTWPVVFPTGPSRSPGTFAT